MNVIVVNGMRIEVPDGTRNIVVTGDMVKVGGVVVSQGLQGIVKVEWEGPLASLECGCEAVIKGDVHGDARAGNSISCGNVGGDARAGNSLNCGDIKGNAKAGNSINRR